MSPQQYLVPGNVVDARIGDLGSQKNLCVAATKESK